MSVRVDIGSAAAHCHTERSRTLYFFSTKFAKNLEQEALVCLFV